MFVDGSIYKIERNSVIFLSPLIAQSRKIKRLCCWWMFDLFTNLYKNSAMDPFTRYGAGLDFYCRLDVLASIGKF